MVNDHFGYILGGLYGTNPHHFVDSLWEFLNVSAFDSLSIFSFFVFAIAMSIETHRRKIATTKA